MLVHVVNVAYRKIDAAGTVLTKDDVNETLKQHMNFSHDFRVTVNVDVPNSSGNPSVVAYLEAEANDDFVVQHLDNTTIIIYKRNTANGGFPAA